MRRYLLIIMFVFFIVSCTSGKTEFFPSTDYSVDMAKVTVIREKRLFGFGVSLRVVLDGEVIARLKAGQYVTFYINPGVHRIGLPESTIAVPFQGGRKHFILIKATSDQYGWEVETVSEQKGAFWMTQSKSIE